QSGGNTLGAFGGRENNVSTIDQTLGSDGASATVVQNGELNLSDIDQSADATATVTQNGIYNTSSVLQSADDASAQVTQGGGYGDNVSTVTQSAQASAVVNQTGQPSVGPDFTNISDIDQSGAGSSADLSQNGSNNSSGVTQTGANSLADVDQDGTH